MFSFRWLRIVVAALSLTTLSALFLDFTEIVPLQWHWIAHLQITPAILEFGMIGLIVCLSWLAITLLFGRVYCSVICPLGVVQDIFSRISKTIRGKKGKYRFRRGMMKTRLTFLGLFLLSLLAVPVGVTILDPYSSFGRIVTSLLRPLYLTGNNFLAHLVGGRFHFQSVHVETHVVVAALTVLILIGTFSFLFGRRYCNTICPVGTLLGLLSKYSCFKVRLKSDCISCGLCEKTCKGECIDAKNKTVDASRCVACFNCLGTCKRNSILYSIPLKNIPKPMDEGLPENQAVIVPVEVPPGSGADRRSFLQWSVFSLFIPSLAGSLGASRSSVPPVEPSLPTGVSRVSYETTASIMPPGATNLKHFQRRCTGCHLCVSKCPANIIRPSTIELGLAGFLQPVVKFDYGFCNYDCTICTEVCPSHALIPKTTEEKHRLQIGTVVFLKENCVVETQGSNCGACAEHCPTGAVKMIEYGDPAKHLTIPVVEPKFCIGCGACEYICPVRPYRAIYIDGMLQHKEAELSYDPNAKQESVELDGFGF